MIKIFKFNDENLIEKTINDWAENNKFKIDSISVSPNKWYYNSSHSMTTDVQLIVIINYHKRRIRKSKNIGDNKQK